MRIKPHVLRTGNEILADKFEAFRTDHVRLTDHRDLAARDLINVSPQTTQVLASDPVFAPQVGPQALAFTPGNIVVYRVGDGVAALSNASAAVFIDEYTITGAFVQTIALPIADLGANQTLTAAGTSTSEGLLTLSTDGHYLLLTGYDTAPGLASVSGTTGAAVNRVIGRIGADGSVNTTTALADFSSGSSPRGVASTNGTDIWIGGGAGGVRYTTIGSTTSTQISTTITNIRSVEIFDGQLYVSSMSGAIRLATVGTGLPTTAGQTISNLGGLPTTGSTNSPYQFFFADLTSSVAGVDTLYISDDATGLLKYSLVAGTWTLNGTVGANADDYVGLTASVSGTTVTLYATRLSGGAADTIVSLVDAGGYNANFSSLTPNVIVTAATNTGFRGIAFAPTPAAGGAGSLAIDDVTHVEGNSGTTTYTFTVTRSGGSTGAVTVDWTLAAPGGAGVADSTDFAPGQPTSGTLSFADGETTKTITILVQGDVTIEGLETFSVNLTNATGGATVSDAFGTGTITNDDFPTISVGDVTQLEQNAGTSIFAFTVSLSAPAGPGGVTFDITTADGVALAGSDYVAQSLTGVTIAAGQSSYTFNVVVNGDTTFEPDESFFVNISNVTGATVADGQGLGTITNDDAAPSPGSISIGDVDLAEGNSGATLFTFTVLRSGGSLGAVSATWTVDAPGGAGIADVSDFVPASALTGTVSFADGQTSATITVSIQGDVTFEGDETFLVTLSAPQGGVTIGNGNGTGRILNDDAPPAGGFSINNVTLSEGDAGTTTFTFTVTRSGGSAGTVTVDYATANDSAASGSDYAAASGTLTFLDGELTKTVTVTVNGDTDVETNETFFVNLTNATGGASITDGQGIGTITNDDIPPAPGSVSVGDVSITEGNAGTSILTFTLTRTGGSGAFDVNYATSNGGFPDHASATAGSDYVAASGTVSFGAGVNTQTVSVTINGDTLAELSEEFTLTLSSPTNGATISDGTAIGLIVNDDTPPASVQIFGENFTGFTGGGFAPVPAAGQIDSDIWRVVGLSDITNPAYGFTATTGDFARGTITTNDPTTAGVYSISGNAAMVLQPTGGELEAGGFIEARITNTSGSTATGFDVGFDWVYRNNADRASALEFSYSTDGTNFITVPAAAFTTPGALATGATFTLQNETLSLSGLSVANGGFLYMRWTHVSSTGSGNRDEFGIDNVTVSTTGGASGPLVSVSDVSVNESAGTMTFTVTRSNVAMGAFTVDYATSNGTALAGSDYAPAIGTLLFADNQVSATVTVTINNDGTPELDETLFLNLSGATGGATIADGQAQGTIVNDDGTPIQVSVNDVSIVEGQSGTSILTFTVTRTGGTGAFDVSFATANDTATAGSDYVATSGTLNFGAGVNTQTISVTINGDLTQEQTERFFVNLSNPTNDAIIIDGQGIGTIVNDEPTLIHDIQGTAYFSPLLAGEGINAFNIASTNAYTVRAIVTAVDNVGARQGFYVTEEITDWDGNTFTSEGIFVMTRNDANVGTVVSGVTVGDLVQFSANIMEYQSFQSMPRTVLVNPTGFSVISQGNALPTVTLTNIPNSIMTVANPDYFDSVDGAGDTFDASLYALSYFETVEGMLVTVPNMVVADGFVGSSGGDIFFQAYSLDSANPEQINSRGGYTIAGDPPLAPPDTPNPNDGTVNGGQVLHDGDVNPDMIEVDFTDFAISAPAGLSTSASMGDFLGNITGIIDFDFTALKLFVTDINAGTFIDRTTTVETSGFGSDARSLTVATFNVENLDPGDGAARFTAIANAIANNLKSPDIICIEEMQDNNGATASGGADASTTWNMLVSALNAATGKVYQWVDQEPNGSEGGEPGGNIRVGFLYDTGRVQLGNLDANASLAERRAFTDRIGDGVRDAGDLLAFDDSMLGGEINTTDWAGTRRSLLGEFTFNGNTVYVTANHWPAKGGSGEFWQVDQAGGDPANSDWAQRNAVGQDVYSMMNLIQQTNSQAGIVAGGDFNDFYFYRPLTTVTGYTMADGTARVGGARFENLTLTLPEAERYTYTFDGRSQAIDHIIVNGILGAVASYDVVHLNTGFNPTGNPQLSDHEPAVASFDFRSLSEILMGTAANDAIEGFGGNDRLFGNNGNDYLDGGVGSDITTGGAGDDVHVIDNAGDRVIEAVGGGNDLVFTSLSYALEGSQEIEVLAARDNSQTVAMALLGNEFANTVLGNNGANFLDGGAGADVLAGFGGNDNYAVDNAGDQVIEGAGGGNDAVFSTVSYQLAGGSSVEMLAARDNSQTTSLALVGNEIANTILGNNGGNFIDGGAGADILAGFGGNDVYAVDNAGDIVVEDAGGGTDTVYASASFALNLGTSVETLSARDNSATTAINLVGNEIANMLTGNNGANYLDGGAGSDVLVGYGGADMFAFTTALGVNNVDTVADFVNGTDKIGLDDAIFTGLGATLNANAFVIGATAADADDRIIYNSATGQLYYDADGSGAGAAVQFATLAGGLSLTASDFVMI